MEIKEDIDATDKKGQLLDAALQLFSEHGFDGTSVRMVADKAGMNVSMISYYFGSKEKMFDELIVRKTEYMRQHLAALVGNETLDPWQKLEQLIDRYTDRILTSGGGFHRLLVRELSLRQRAETTKIIEEKFAYNLEAFRAIVMEGVKKNIFHEAIDIPMLMSMMIGTITQSTMSANLICRLMQIDRPVEAEKLSSIQLEEMKARVTQHLKKVFACYLLISPAQYGY